MKRRQWKSKTKAMIALEGLKGRPMAELGNTHQISQAQYYQWREQFLAKSSRGFETQTVDQRMTQLQRENAKPKALIGDLTVELKKRRGVGIKRGTYAKASTRNHHLSTSIRPIKPDHSFWGYCRVWAYVCYLEQQMVTQKRISPLMKLHDLLVNPNLRLKASRVAHRRKPKPTGPNR